MPGRGTLPPLEQSMRSTPISRSSRAALIVSSRSQPPSTQSVADSRTKKARSLGQAERIAVATSRRKRTRPLKDPP